MKRCYFLLAIYAKHGYQGPKLVAEQVEATSLEEAEQKGRALAVRKLPLSDGWTEHYSHCVAVIGAAYANAYSLLNGAEDSVLDSDELI
jgi:hypothetical protein